MKITIAYKAFAEPPAPVRTVTIEITHTPDTPALEVKDEEALLDWLFRQLNRVDDHELVSLFGLPVPSLSVDDEIQIDDHVFLVLPVGFQRLP